MSSGRRSYQGSRILASSRADLAPDGRHPNWGHPDHDACGTGFIARLAGPAGYDIVQHALTALERLLVRTGSLVVGYAAALGGFLLDLRGEIVGVCFDERGGLQERPAKRVRVADRLVRRDRGRDPGPPGPAQS